MIFLLVLQIITIAQMMSTGGEGGTWFTAYIQEQQNESYTEDVQASHLSADEVGILVKKLRMSLWMLLLVRDEVAYLPVVTFHYFLQNNWFECGTLFASLHKEHKIYKQARNHLTRGHSMDCIPPPHHTEIVTDKKQMHACQRRRLILH